MPLYRLRSRFRDRGTPAIHDLPIEAPTVRHAAARVLGQADAMFGDRNGEAWLVTEDGARVWSLSLDAQDLDAQDLDAQHLDAQHNDGAQRAWN